MLIEDGKRCLDLIGRIQTHPPQPRVARQTPLELLQKSFVRLAFVATGGSIRLGRRNQSTNGVESKAAYWKMSAPHHRVAEYRIQRAR
jgi:hypothetical protein